MNGYPLLEKCRMSAARGWEAMQRAVPGAANKAPRIRISFDIDDTLACQLHHCDVEPSRILRALHAAGSDLLRSCQRLFRNHRHRRNPVLVGVGALADGTVLVHNGCCRSRASFSVRSRKIQGARRAKVTSCLF